jgi:predicted restriction endonuclease
MLGMGIDGTDVKHVTWAFDRGLMTLDEGMRVVISGRLRGGDVPVLQRVAFGELEGRRLRMPGRFGPDAGALAWHREHVVG